MTRILSGMALNRTDKDPCPLTRVRETDNAKQESKTEHMLHSVGVKGKKTKQGRVGEVGSDILKEGTDSEKVVVK